MSEEIDKLAGATSLKISEMTLESDLMGAEKFPFVREGVKDNFITTLNRIKEYVQKDVCQYIRDLRETDLNTFKGGEEADICVIGVQRNNKFATPENHYPTQEAGIFIAVGTITDKTNQFYQTYDKNKLFIRCATSSGLNGEFSDWQEIAKISDVLTKNNTTPFSPTNDYNPATKKYADNIGYGKVIDVADGSLLTINKNIWGTEAYGHVVKIFGSTDVIKNMIIDIYNNHTKYYIHSYSSYRNCIELSSVYAYYTDEERYEIEFNISYYTSQGPISKRIAIALNLFDDDKNDDRLFIEDILVSDNLQRVVKRTKTEYDSIGIKDNSTMYAITE